MKKLALLSSFALAAAVSPLLGQTLPGPIFFDDFSTSTATGNPDDAIWGTNVRNETADKTMKVTSANGIFGEIGRASCRERAWMWVGAVRWRREWSDDRGR